MSARLQTLLIVSFGLLMLGTAPAVNAGDRILLADGALPPLHVQLQLPPSNTNLIEQPLPPNGSLRRETRDEAIARFKISSSGSSHHLVKMEDAYTSRSVLTVFVRAGQDVEIRVPLGTYVVKYAAGEKWYGYQDRFGPNTAYSKADQNLEFARRGNQITGYSITLYAVSGGNLSTTGIAAGHLWPPAVGSASEVSGPLRCPLHRRAVRPDLASQTWRSDPARRALVDETEWR
jgi:hypothetical protein